MHESCIDRTLWNNDADTSDQDLGGPLPVAQVLGHLRIQRMVSSTFPVIRFNNPFAPTSSFHPGSQLFGKLLLIHDSSHGLESF